MVEMLLTMPNDLAQKIQPMRPWLPFVLELSLAGFKTPAAQTASEIIDFLATGPTPLEVMGYTVSEERQKRLRRLLALNQSGLLSPEEQAELDEIEKIEHLMILLKARVQQQLMPVAK